MTVQAETAIDAGTVSIALIEDNPADQRLLVEMVVGSESPRFDVSTYGRLDDAMRELVAGGGEEASCVILDLSLPDAEGMEGIDQVRESLPSMPLVIITGRDDEEMALRALQAGAQDYLIKGKIDTDTLRRSVRYAIERMRSEADLAELMRENELILDSAGEGLCGIDPDGSIRFANPAAAALLGRERDELIGEDAHEALHGDAHEREDCPIIDAVSRRTRSVGEEDSFVRGGGGRFPAQRTVNPIDEGDRSGAVLSFSDLTERKRFESQLAYVADHDTVTGLFNRSRLEESLEREIALSSRYQTGGALLMLDLDNFKYVNDTLGHAAGDELLRSFARLLEAEFSDGDVIARLGGDEFAVLLANADRDRAMEAADHLLEAVRNHSPSIGRQPLRVTSSVGVTMIDRAEVTPGQLFVEADVAMYEAKHAGRDKIALFRPGVTDASAAQASLTWSDRIRQGLEEERFRVFSQPIVELPGREPTHHELLIRMEGDDGGMVLPGDFIPAAERFGLIQALDGWMAGEAARLAAEARKAGSPVVVEVNLSGRTIGDPQILEVIEAELAASGASPGDLVFEITETAAVANLESAREFAERLRGLGCAFALDDFGAGFGSFYYLKYFPLDYLKIDGEFVKNLPNSEIDQRMVRAMVEVARGLGLKTIAEFVEEEETIGILAEFGVDYCQGFHIARPAPVGPGWPSA